jgi:hypothetical protein
MTVTPTTAEVEQKTYCTVHPNVETGLKCNKCGRYMCIKCAVKTPVGYRCRQCVNQQQQGYYNASNVDYLIAAVVSFVIGLPAGYIFPRLGLFFILIGAIPVGGFIGELVHRAVGRRRGQFTWLIAAGGVVVAALLIFGFTELRPMLDYQRALAAAGAEADEFASQALIMQLVGPILYLVFCVGALVARLRYGK